MTKNNYPERVLRVLRQVIGERGDRLNHELDEQCNAIEPHEVMRHLIAWEFGDPGGYTWLNIRLEDVGLEIVEKEQS